MMRRRTRQTGAWMISQSPIVSQEFEVLSVSACLFESFKTSVLVTQRVIGRLLHVVVVVVWVREGRGAAIGV